MTWWSHRVRAIYCVDIVIKWHKSIGAVFWTESKSKGETKTDGKTVDSIQSTSTKEATSTKTPFKLSHDTSTCKINSLRLLCSNIELLMMRITMSFLWPTFRIQYQCLRIGEKSYCSTAPFSLDRTKQFSRRAPQFDNGALSIKVQFDCFYGRLYTLFDSRLRSDALKSPPITINPQWQRVQTCNSLMIWSVF